MKNLASLNRLIVVGHVACYQQISTCVRRYLAEDGVAHLTRQAEAYGKRGLVDGACRQIAYERIGILIAVRQNQHGFVRPRCSGAIDKAAAHKNTATDTGSAARIKPVARQHRPQATPS